MGHRGKAHTHPITPQSFWQRLLVACQYSVSCSRLRCCVSGGGVSDLESVCYRLSPNTRANAVLFRGTLTPSASLLKCWWFILEAIFTPPQVFVCRCRIYPSESSFFHISLNEAPPTPKAERLQRSLPVTSSQVTHTLSICISCLPPTHFSALPFRQSSEALNHLYPELYLDMFPLLVSSINNTRPTSRRVWHHDQASVNK